MKKKCTHVFQHLTGLRGRWIDLDSRGLLSSQTRCNNVSVVEMSVKSCLKEETDNNYPPSGMSSDAGCGDNQCWAGSGTEDRMAPPAQRLPGLGQW